MTMFLPDPYSRDVDVNSIVYKFIDGKRTYVRVMEVIKTGFPNCDKYTKYVVKPVDKDYVREQLNSHKNTKEYKKEKSKLARMKKLYERIQNNGK